MRSWRLSARLEAREDHAERALHAALAMQRRLEEGLTLRVGVNTGEVVVGTAREGSSFVSGDAVNAAARLEQAAEPGEILAGERTVAADANGITAFRDGRFEEAHELESSRFRFRRELVDPDLVHDLYLSTVPTAAATGRLAEARRLTHDLGDVVADLTPHHRLHAAAMSLEIEELEGTWMR